MKALIVVGILVFAGCGGEGDTSSRADERSEAAADTDNEAAGRDEPRASLTVEDLRAAMLTVADLPEGFAASPPEKAGDDGDDEYCDDRDPTTAVPAAVEAEVAFQQDAFGPFVGESLAQYADDDQARRIMDEVRDVLADCASYEQTNDGQTSEVTLSELSFDNRGDDTVAMRVSISGGFPFTANLIAVRHGDLVVLVSHGAIGPVDFDLTKTIVATALDKAEPLYG